ncbi:MAG: heavy-metal-associated domain-containing protein [Candidatus Obscuribacterales bacterium]|nr:heavy-metal-associated domain-containing protein [Candidatus Obscuribacterales bacterium]
MEIRKLSLLIAATMILCVAAPAITAPTSPGRATTAEKKSGQKLHRADFRVAGASCVGCIRRVGRILRSQKGVLKADVSIFKPYWAIVIYNSDDVNLEQLQEACKVEKVKFEEIEDKSIAEVPLIVIPKGMNKVPESGH